MGYEREIERKRESEVVGNIIGKRMIVSEVAYERERERERDEINLALPKDCPGENM